MPTKEELAKAGLELCDGIGKLMADGKMDETFPLVARLSEKTEALADPDVRH
jgi:hypothetical protein